MFFGAFVGYSVTNLVLEHKNEGSKDFASIDQSHASHSLTKLASQQIYQDYFDIRIKHEDISTDSDKSSVVKAVITAKRDLPAGLNYQWKLGQDVTSSAADVEGQLPEFKQGEKKELFLTVYGFHKKAQTYLSFILNGTIDNHILAKETLSSSRPEDSFEYVVQQQHELEKQESKKMSGKVSTQSAQRKKFDIENIVK